MRHKEKEFDTCKAWVAQLVFNKDARLVQLKKFFKIPCCGGSHLVGLRLLSIKKMKSKPNKIHDGGRVK
jgi:hypothetical protein